MNPLSEKSIIERIKEAGGRVKAPDLVKGIGDDCAVFHAGGGRLGLLTADMSVEGTHFRTGIMDPFDIGFRSMTANISDIAAMNGRPLYALVSLGLPPQSGPEFIDSLYQGMNRCAGLFSVPIIGGDTVRSPNTVISITLYGEASPDAIIYRRGARPGDAIYITGFTGCSLAGLNLLYSNPASEQKKYPVSMARHLRPLPALEALAIISGYKPGAMIDISDGILTDLRRLSEESGTGFIIDLEALPLHPELMTYAAAAGLDPREMALSSGEEYELLFTAPEKDEAGFHGTGSVRITKIGRVTEEGFLISDEGTLKPAPEAGFGHF